MPSQFDFGYIDSCIDQLTAVEDAFNIYRETGCLDALQRLNADSKSKPFLQKWLDIAKLPESDRTLTQLKSDSFNISRLSPYSDIMLHCQKDWRNPLDLIHIIYVYRGTFRCEMKNRDLTLTTGNCFMFNVNIVKQISPCDSNAQLLNCLISRNYLENILLKQFDQNILFSDFLTQSFYTDSTSEPMLAFDTSGDLDVKYAFAMAIIEHANHRPLWQTMVNNYISTLMILLLRIHMANWDKQHYLQLGRHKLSEVLLYIDHHYNTATLESIAATFHFHPNYLSKIIKDNTGLTFTDILQYTRLKQAALLLKNTDLSIANIAHQVGYNNISFFYKLFQKKYRLTPAEYRAGRE